jgi:hypothetical protein
MIVEVDPHLGFFQLRFHDLRNLRPESMTVLILPIRDLPDPVDVRGDV